MKSADYIVDLWQSRKTAAGPGITRMLEIQQLYDGDVVVPLPELNASERSSVPNRVQNGLTQMANRIASTLPNLECPPVREGIQSSEDRADDRRRAVLGWWSFGNFSLKLRERALHLQGYGSTPVRIRWDAQRGVPCWWVLNPLNTFPGELCSTDLAPADCVVESSRTYAWLRATYPDLFIMLRTGRDPKPDDRFTLLEYCDDAECSLTVVGSDNGDYGARAQLVEWYPNRAQRCPVLAPRMLSMSRPHGQFDGMWGMYQTEAMLMALSIIATKKGVFADEWLVARQGETPQIVQVPDSMSGIPGIVSGGDLVPRGVDPQFQTNITIDRLAAAQNQTAGLSSDMQGVSGSNIRTGRRGSQLLSAVIDFPIQAAQELLASSLQEENKTAIAFAKGYGEGPKTFYVPWRGAQGNVTYDPTKTFETDENIVSYSLAGTDAQGLTIEALQRVGASTMSKRSWMEMDPMIEDADREERRIVDEKMTEAFLTSVLTLASQPQGPYQPVDLAALHRYLVVDRMSPFDAVDKVQQEAQARQAQAAPTPEAAQPGLSMPGQGVEQPSIGPAPNQQGLAQLLSTLHQQQTAGAAA